MNFLVGGAGKWKFKEARKSAGLTQKEVAQAMNVTAATYSRYENGLIQPDPETLKRIAVLNIKP